MTNLDIDHLISLYLSNHASESQKQELGQWINASEANREVFEHIKKLWSEPAEVRVDNNTKKKRDAIWEAGTGEKEIKKPEASVVDISYWSKIAATLLIVLMSSWIVYQLTIPNKFFKAEVAPYAVAIIKKENPAGQKSMHMLPDGTQVWLNAESILTYPEVFSDTLRLIKLTGEAYFEVAYNKNRPFIVETYDTRTQALGTAFNIHAYPEDKMVKISLLEGKVRVQALPGAQGLPKVQTSVLSPGEELHIPNDGAEFTLHKFNYEKTFGWKEGILVFDGVDFETFRSVVEKWYGVKVEVKGAPRIDWNIRARYKNESLKEVLRDISFNKNFKFELKDKELLITFKEEPMT
jgi:transmembrane sensor